MKHQVQVPASPRRPFSFLLHGLLWGALVTVPGCGKDGGAAAGGGSTAAAAEKPLDHPAHAAEAAQRLDLTTFPLMDGASDARQRTLANLSYRVTADMKSAYAFQLKNLSSLNWVEQPGATVTDQYASGTFARAGFHVSVTVSPSGEAGKVDIMLHNHGNVDLAKLPLPPGTKPVYVGPLTAMHETQAPAAATADECRKLLTSAGWQPYGASGDSAYFKQNAVLLNVTVNAAPGGKTMISFLSEQMSADIPAMPGAGDLRYADSSGTLDFDTTSSDEEVSQFYRKALAGSGWEATLDKLMDTDGKKWVIFRNPAKDMLTLEIKKALDAKSRVSLIHQSAAVVAELDRHAKEQIEKMRKQHAEAQNKPAMKVTLTLPADATGVKQAKQQVQFNVASGKAKAAVEAIQKPLLDAGWKAGVSTLEAMMGTVALSKDGQSLNILYTDTGVLPAEVTVTVTGAEIEAAGAQH